MLLNTDGSLQRNGRLFPSLLREFLDVTSLRWRFPRWFERKFEFGRTDFDKECEVDNVTGACLLVRAEAVKQVGLLDERFYMYYEEIDWCHRMRRAGWTVHYVPSSRVVHHWMGSIKGVAPQMVAHLSRSRLLYFRKNKGLLASLLLQTMQGVRSGVVVAGVAVKRGLRRVGVIRRAA
jgi:GT2 family glycosyltransferase